MDEKIKIYILMFVLVVAVILSQLAVFSAMQQKLVDRQTDNFAGQELIQARTISASLVAEISNVVNSMKFISKIPEIENGNPEECNKKLEEVFSSLENPIGNLERSDKNGIVYCATVKSTIGTDGKIFPDLKKILDNPYDEKNITVSRISYSPYVNRYSIFIRILIFDDEGSFEGILSGVIYVDHMEDKYLENAIIAKQGYVVLMDDNGDIIYHPRQEFVAKNFWSAEWQTIIKGDININALSKDLTEGKSGIRRYFFEGSEIVAAYAPANFLEGKSWGVIITVPIEDIEAALGISKRSFDIFGFLYLFSVMSALITILIFALFAAKLTDKYEFFKGKVKRKQASGMKINFTKITSLKIISLILIIICLPAWIFFAVPQLTSLPKDFTYSADVFAVDNFYDEGTNQFSGEQISKTVFSYAVVGERNGIYTIKNIFDVRTPNGGPIFSVERLYGIDPETGMHVAEYGDKIRSGYLFAPQNLQKGQNFVYWHINYDEPAYMEFQDEEMIDGLTVYRYETDYHADQTEDLDYLHGVPELRGVNLDINLQLWVEPVTRWLIKYEDKTTAYYYNISTGERIHPWDSFSNKYTDVAVENQINFAKGMKNSTLFYEIGVPIILLIISAGLFYASRRKKKLK